MSLAAATALAAGSFDTIAGWENLPWGMTVEDARAALAAAGAKPEFRDFPKDGTCILKFQREGWESGTAYFNDRGLLCQVLLQSAPLKEESAARARAAEVEKAYGAPASTRAVRYGDGREDSFFEWNNGQTVLTITLAHYIQEKHWIVWEEYLPVTPPPSLAIPADAPLGELLNPPVEIPEPIKQP